MTNINEHESILIRDAEHRDFDEILALNEADVEVLSPIDEDILTKMSGCAELFKVAEVDVRVAGFIMVMREGSTYWSDNYKWFEDHYDKFLYVDRIVIGDEFRGLGIARKLYEFVISHARENDVPCVTSEIDIEPIYNEPSIKFHKSMGFKEVGTKPFKETITVSLQKLDV